uniref:Uncharacterized protein n=1 Tax=Anguilla anguilla TaxID=7936 RepID=A0A0E9PIS0_ANGAN
MLIYLPIPEHCTGVRAVARPGTFQNHWGPFQLRLPFGSENIQKVPQVILEKVNKKRRSQKNVPM